MAPSARKETASASSADYDLTFWEQIRLFARFFRYVRPYRDKLVLGILLIFVGVPLGQIGYFLSRYLWDDVLLSSDRPTDQRISMFFGQELEMFVLPPTMAITRV